MSLIFSRQCEYAIQSVLYLALKPKGEMVSLTVLANQLGIPYHYLGKILQSLTRKGLLISHKGPSGGFALGMPAEDITLFHVIEAVDGIEFTRRCVLGFAECSKETRCSVHEEWSKARDAIYNMLIRKSIAEMAHSKEGAGHGVVHSSIFT